MVEGVIKSMLPVIIITVRAKTANWEVDSDTREFKPAHIRKYHKVHSLGNNLLYLSSNVVCFCIFICCLNAIPTGKMIPPHLNVISFADHLLVEWKRELIKQKCRCEVKYNEVSPSLIAYMQHSK